MEIHTSAYLGNSNEKLLYPGKNYLVKRLIKVVLWLIILDLVLLGFFWILGALSFEEVDLGRQIFEWGIFSTFLLTLGIGLYYGIGMPWLIRTLSYKITDEALIVERGRLTKVKIIVPFRTITNVTITQGPFDRAFSIGHLLVETAGFAMPISGKMGVDQYIEGLESSILNEVYNFIFHKIQSLRGIYSTTTEERVRSPETSYDKEARILPELIKDLTTEIKEFRRTIEKFQE